MSDPRLIDNDTWITEVRLGDYDVRGAFVAGRDRAVVWDTLSHPRDMTGYQGLIGGRDLVIVYSHADWDHAWGTGGLASRHAAIIGHASCAARFRDDVPITLREKQAAEPGAWDAVTLVAPNVTFDHEMTLDLGGVTLTLRHLPGHTRDSIVGLVPERGILLVGDAAETPLPVVPAGSPLPSWIEELRRWSRDPRVRTVVPAHGAIGGREILERNIAYLQGLLCGRPIAVGEPLTPFYRETHEANVRGRLGDAMSAS